VIRFFGEKTAVVVGHDWGAAVAWTAAWLHPELVRGVVGLSAPFADRALCPLPGNSFGEVRPKLIYGGLAGPGQTFYQEYFGRMDAIVTEFESDVRGWLLGATWSFSGDALSQLGINMDQIDPVERLSLIGGPRSPRPGRRGSKMRHSASVRSPRFNAAALRKSLESFTYEKTVNTT
jgi:epoxide hydrolase A/B